MESDHKLVRLSKLMSERGICSRREADEMISKGWVMVNGKIVSELGSKFDPEVRITLVAEALQSQKELVSVILNKPIGYVSAQPEKGYEPAIRLLTKENFDGVGLTQKAPRDLEHLAVVGRLDIDSQGLLLFTQDGRLAKKVIGEDGKTEKEYLVRVKGQLSNEQLKLLSHGLELDGEKLKPAKVEWINEDQLRFVLLEGKKRQVRRMCEMMDLKVLGLKRVRIGSLMLGHLPEGKWRFVNPNEI